MGGMKMVERAKTMERFYIRTILMGKSANDLAIEMSSLREEKGIDKANLTNTLSELLRAMQNLNEQKRVGRQGGKI